MKLYTVAVLGATGAVGQEMMKILEERDFPAVSGWQPATRSDQGICRLPAEYQWADRSKGQSQNFANSFWQ